MPDGLKDGVIPAIVGGCALLVYWWAIVSCRRIVKRLQVVDDIDEENPYAPYDPYDPPIFRFPTSNTSNTTNTT